MNTKTLLVPLLLGAIAVMSCFAGDSTAEQKLRDLDEQWSKAAGSKDVDKTVSFYSDDALVLPPNEPALNTKDGIRNLWQGFLVSVTDISWKTTRVELAKSGEMACLTGMYEMTMKDGTKDRGKFCEVWEKSADGTWKCGTDMFSSDLRAPGSSPSPRTEEKN